MIFTSSGETLFNSNSSNFASFFSVTPASSINLVISDSNEVCGFIVYIILENIQILIDKAKHIRKNKINYLK